MKVFVIIMLALLLAFDIFVVIEYFKLIKENKEKPVKPELTREEKEKQEQLRKSFDNLMNYDENIARKIRK